MKNALFHTLIIGLGLTILASAALAQAPQEAVFVCIPAEIVAREADEVESGVRRAGLAMIDTVALQGVERGRLQFDLFSDTSFTGIVESAPMVGENVHILLGTLDGYPGGTFSLSLKDESTVANFNVPGRGHFQIRPRGEGLHRVTEVNADLLPTCSGGEIPSAAELQMAPAPQSAVGAMDDSSIFDVLVAYTPKARQRYGGHSGIEALIYLAMVETNAAYVSSGINSRLRLAGLMEVDYLENGNFATELTRLRLTTDGHMDEVHAERNRVGADLVTLIIDSTASCGRGYVLQNISNPFAAWAFNVVSQNCTTGYYSFAHELGHNMGCAHDRGNASVTGATVYSYGFRWVGSSTNQYRSIMAYAPGTRIRHFSNPEENYDGVATGVHFLDLTNSADNARSINYTANTVANWRQSVSHSILIGDDVELTEEDSGSQTATIWVQLNPSSTSQVTVDFATVAQTATDGVDFADTSGELVFAPGEVVKRINIAVMGDIEPEEDETFLLELSNASGAAIGDAQASVMIYEDDRLEHLILPALLGQRSLTTAEEDIADQNRDNSVDAADVVTEIQN